METPLSTEITLVMLPIAWLAMQLLCWWGLSHLVPQRALRPSVTDQPRHGACGSPERS